MDISTNKIFQQQQNKLTPATFKKGVISAVYSNTWTVDVYLIGNSQTIIKGIPASSTIDFGVIRPGQLCRIDVFDETNPNDMVLAYTYGAGTRKKALFASGTIDAAISGTIPHGLGQIPDIWGVFPMMQLTGIGQFWGSAEADAINLYVVGSNSVGNPAYLHWFAVKF